MTDRGISIALSYVLVTSITVILVGGLIIAGSTFVEDQRDNVVEEELQVIGNQLAGNLEQIDRMVAASNASFPNTDKTPDAAAVNETFPTQVSGSSYTIQLGDGGSDPPRLVLTAAQVDVSVEVVLRVDVAVENDAAATGGEVEAYYDESDEELVITDA